MGSHLYEQTGVETPGVIFVTAFGPCTFFFGALQLVGFYHCYVRSVLKF